MSRTLRQNATKFFLFFTFGTFVFLLLVKSKIVDKYDRPLDETGDYERLRVSIQSLIVEISH